MKLLSVNAGRSESITIGRKVQRTGIHKLPARGPVRISRLGVTGDFIGDARHHGGPDQAVYLYSQVDYDWWTGKLGRTLEPGTFGENLLVSDFGSSDLRIGDRYQIGEVLLEITSPRIPCATLATKMGDPHFVRTFKDAARPGAYARVLSEGLVETGMSVQRMPAESHGFPVIDLWNLWYASTRDRQTIEAAMEAAVAERSRARLQEWLDEV